MDPPIKGDVTEVNWVEGGGGCIYMWNICVVNFSQDYPQGLNGSRVYFRESEILMSVGQSKASFSIVRLVVTFAHLYLSDAIENILYSKRKKSSYVWCSW